MAIRKMREENGHPFKTYERGFPVGRLEVNSMFPDGMAGSHISMLVATIMLSYQRP